MTGPVDPASGLDRAARVFLARLQQRDPEPVAEFLQRHAALREWLEPMLVDSDDEGAGASAGVASVPLPAEERRLGPFTLLREIGRGGMGIVHEARRSGDVVPVALKVLPQFHALVPQRAQRFAREAELARAQRHPGLVAVLDAGTVGDTAYLAMEFVPGAPLDAVLGQLAGRPPASLVPADLAAAVVRHQHVPQGSTSPDATIEAFAGSYVACVARVVLQVAEALVALHGAGIVHRDIKPSNILLTATGRVVVTDFGLARAVDDTSLTATGDFAGTPHYVSPEQAMAKRVHVDHRTDLFSLGSTCYELLCLQRAFPGDTTPEVLGRIVHKEPVRVTRWHPALPADLVTILERLLEKDPDRRYPTAAALVADLRAFLDYRPVQAQRVSTLTRVVRWTRREPLRATLLAVLLVTLPTLAGGAGYLWARQSEIAAGREELRRQQVERLVDDGHLLMIQEDHAAALGKFRAALALGGDRNEATLGLVLALLRVEGPEVALQALDGGLGAILPSSLAALLRFPLLHRLQRPEADRLREQLPRPHTADEWFLVALLDRDMGTLRGTQLLEGIERAVLASDRPRLWLHVHWAVFADEAADAASARRCAGNVLANWPDLPLAHHLACLAARRTDAAEAQRLVAVAGERWPADGLTALSEGLVAEARGDGKAAIAALQRAVARMPGAMSVRYRLGRLRYELGDHQAALADMVAARDASPRFVEAWLGIGLCQRRLGDAPAALAALQRAVELNATHAESRFQLGQQHVQAGDFAAGLVQLRAAVGLNPNDPNKWHHVAHALFSTGDDVGGEAALRRAVAADPRYERGHAMLAMCLTERGTPAQARAALADWVAALPGSVAGWLQYGDHCLREGLDGVAAEPALAVWAARRVLALAGDGHGPAWLLLGEAELRLGRATTARDALQRALAATTALAPAQRARGEQLLAGLGGATAR